MVCIDRTLSTFNAKWHSSWVIGILVLHMVLVNEGQSKWVSNIARCTVYPLLACLMPLPAQSPPLLRRKFSAYDAIFSTKYCVIIIIFFFYNTLMYFWDLRKTAEQNRSARMSNSSFSRPQSFGTPFFFLWTFHVYKPVSDSRRARGCYNDDVGNVSSASMQSVINTCYYVGI